MADFNHKVMTDNSGGQREPNRGRGCHQKRGLFWRSMHELLCSSGGEAIVYLAEFALSVRVAAKCGRGGRNTPP